MTPPGEYAGSICVAAGDAGCYYRFYSNLFTIIQFSSDQFIRCEQAFKKVSK